MDAKRENESSKFNIVRVISQQHPVVLIWLISTFLFILSGYIYSSVILSF